MSSKLKSVKKCRFWRKNRLRNLDSINSVTQKRGIDKLNNWEEVNNTPLLRSRESIEKRPKSTRP